MRLRRLNLKDAPFMLEWMHDESIISGLQQEKFINKTLHDCEVFIEASLLDKYNLHMAIVDDNDTYMGTVSLKNITDNDAEFAITVRSEAHGKGFAKFGMKEIIRMGHEDMKLKNIYWCVRKDNIKAVKFYDKNEYKHCEINPEWFAVAKNMYTEEQMENFLWYCE